jgi:hypothetical protein
MLKKSVEVALKKDKFVISSATRAVVSLSTRVPERIVGLTVQSLPILNVCRIFCRSVPILPSFC